MNILLIGASGFIGTALLEEAVARKHKVTAVTRHPDKVKALTGVTPRAVDINDGKALTDALKGQDAVILAVKYASVNTRGLLETFRKADIPRLLAVGGAGSLETSAGVQVVDTATFPVEWKPEAVAARDFLLLLRDETDLNWTYLSPSAIIEPGKATGTFRLGKDQLITTPSGDSRISTGDYAVALLDELETPSHRRERFTVGY